MCRNASWPALHWAACVCHCVRALGWVGGLPSREAQLASALRASSYESPCGGFDECLPFDECGLHVVSYRCSGCRDESGESRSGSFAGPEPLGGSVEHRGELRGGVGMVFAGCKLGERDGCEVAGGFVSDEGCFEAFVVGAW